VCYNEPHEVGDYLLGKRLCKSCFSEVREAVSTNPDSAPDSKFAVKIIRAAENVSESEDNIQAALSKEIAIWKQLEHPNILPMVEVIETLGVCYIISELVEGGQLLDFVNNVGPLPEQVALHIFHQTCLGVRYLHEQCYLAHRDMKLENVLLQYDKSVKKDSLQPHHIKKVKLCDFGLSEKCDSDTGFPDSTEETSLDSCEARGTPEYCSPEELSSETDIDFFKSDIWALGVMLYALLSGKLPFSDTFWPRLQRSIRLGEYEPLSDSLSEDVKDLVATLLTVNPALRPRIGDVLDHSWFSQIPPMETPFDQLNMTFS
jgi:serine/threonine protein kinase